ncbi:hypothetical protein TTHERM_00841310 (macronuclear) [Tetrahymena thermophila SB210]|uniref:Uncharacterized protein n=1 Tax=Tetrahymena thermophila (strain SB210) TaxID=312017 RepID=I7MMU9_TETTS|nr:hypothetical protein TTHERM_00841310 [Tetrahymena thermophila SB210]EAS07005.2 hypothetical protein TTHERM_00841310 [Tetrahymena thermophila SB210]|eukprot:XP_001027247.2 hypothetical protein TTHERM_00841310 [Tetrahymena thermophila SB210]
MSQSIGQQHTQYQYQQQQMALITNKKQIKQIIPQTQQNSKEKGKTAKSTQNNYNRLYTENSQGSISQRQIFINQCQRTSSNCLFCNKCKKPSQFSLMISTALYSKYSASQNYYFTKDINDILANQRTSAVIQLKDIQTYDEIEEYLNRFYFLHEYDNKIKRLTEYYKFHRDIARLFMVPTTNILNKFHDKKRRIYYIQITRMLKEKEEKEGKKDNQDEQAVALKAEQKSKKEDVNKDNKNKKDEKDLNIEDKNNRSDLCKTLNDNERFLAPLDDLDEQTKSVQSNTLQDLNHKLNDILINSTKSMQSYFFDQDVSQSIGNLSNFLNHLKTQNNQQGLLQAPLASQRQSENILNNQILTETVSNEFIGFNSQQFQNIIQKQGQQNHQPLLINHQILQNNNLELKNGQNLVKNSQNVKNFLKKDSFSKKSQNDLKQQILQNGQNFQQGVLNNKLQSENSIAQQISLNNSPPHSQRTIQESLKNNNIGLKTERESYNLSKDEMAQNQISKLNQDMINLVNFKPQIEQLQQQQNLNNRGKTEQAKDLQKGIAAISSQPSQYLSSIQTQNPSQHQSLNEKHGSNLKQQSLNSVGYNKYQVDGQISSITGFSANNTLNVARNSEKNSANQSTKDAKNYEYPFSNQFSEFTTGKQSITQSVERNSLNSLQQSINGLGKQLNTEGQIVSSLPTEQIKNGLQSKLMSNTSSKYQSQSNKEQKSSQNIQIQNTSQNQKVIISQQNSMNQDQLASKKSFNTQSSDQLAPKKLNSNSGLIIPQIPLPSGQQASSMIIGQQQNQQTLSQQLSQQFQQQFSQQLQNYQRSQVQELQQFSASQRQLSQQSKSELKNEETLKPPNTDRSQYNKKSNQQTLSQKTLSARDKDISSKVVNKGTIDLNQQKQKAFEAINTRRENQFDIQVTLQRNNLDSNIYNEQNIQINQPQLKYNQVQIQNYIANNQQNNPKQMEAQQFGNIQSLIQGAAIKNSSENLKIYQNNGPGEQIQQYQQINGHGRTQTMETYREANLMTSDLQSYSQSQQASRNQSKTKQNIPLQQSNLNQHQNPGSQSTQLTNVQSRQTSQQKSQHSINSQQLSQQVIQNQIQLQNSQIQIKNQQISNENLNIYVKYPNLNEFEQASNPLIASQIKQQTVINDSNVKQTENQQYIPSSNDLSQSHQGQVFLRKSLSNYKFENLGELKQIYKEVQKRTAAMFQKHKDSLKNAQTTATNSSMQDTQQLKQNSQRLNYYAKGEATQRGSQTQRGQQNSTDQSQSKEISPRIQRIQKTELTYQNNSLIKQNSDREQNQRRVSSQIKNSNIGNNSNSLQNQSNLNNKQQQGSLLNVGASQLLLTAQQLTQNNRDQNLTAAQKKLQYKQQASKIGSEQNNRMIHSNPNVDFNKTSYISSYNNSANNTNIYVQGQQNGIQSQQGSGYSTIINNFGSNSQLNANSQIQSVANSHQNSSKKILDKIKHTRINSMNAAPTLHNSQNPSILASTSTFKSHIPAPQSYRQQTQEIQKQPSSMQQQGQSQNYTQFMVSTQNSSNKKTVHHKYTKSEADSLTQSTQPHNLSQNLVSQTNLGFSQLANSNIGNKQTIIKQASSLQNSQSQQHLHGQSNISQILAAQNQQLQSLPSTNQLTQQTAPETKRIMSSVQQTNQNSQSPQRNQYNSAGKKNQQQYFTYSNNNIINIFVNNHQENMKAAQAGNAISNQTHNLHQNINSIINTQMNINKIQQQQSFSQKSQNSPLKKSITNQGKLSARQSENFSNIKNL